MYQNKTPLCTDNEILVYRAMVKHTSKSDGQQTITSLMLALCEIMFVKLGFRKVDTPMLSVIAR
jgi:hypothetical protein